MRVELSGSHRKVQAGNRTEMNAHRITRQPGVTLIQLLVIVAIIVMLFVLLLSDFGVR